MGPKRWQMNELESALKLEREKVAILLEVIEKYIVYFASIHKDGNELKRVKTRIEELGK
jgi:hypothetical protein